MTSAVCQSRALGDGVPSCRPRPASSLRGGALREVTLCRIAARRKYDAPQRSRELADAAIEPLSIAGARGFSHPRVDRHAGVPAGTTFVLPPHPKSVVAGGSRPHNGIGHRRFIDDERTHDADRRPSDILGRWRARQAVMLSGTEPWLTRSKARFELMLGAGRQLAAEIRPPGAHTQPARQGLHPTHPATQRVGATTRPVSRP
jgi:hypothetical protein